MQNLAELKVNDELYGTSSLNTACSHGQVKIVKVLIEKSTELNIDLNAQSGCTAFHQACMQNKSKIVELF